MRRSGERVLADTITVRDTTAPVIMAPADLVLEYPANTSTNATGVATALDAGGSVSISYSDVVSQGIGVASTITRTWTATDACGNSTTAVHTITVRDSSSPVITVTPITTVTAEDLAPGGSGNQTLETVYTNLFPDGISIGLPNDNDPSTPGLIWDGTTNGWSALESVLSQTNLPPGQLTDNGTNSTTLNGGGELALERHVGLAGEAAPEPRHHLAHVLGAGGPGLCYGLFHERRDFVLPELGRHVTLYYG